MFSLFRKKESVIYELESECLGFGKYSQVHRVLGNGKIKIKKIDCKN